VLAVGTLDRRTDVYSLGATLWELLALRPLFGATEQTPTPELMEKVQRGEPARLRRYNPGVSRDLEAIVHRCLEKDANRRYATAADLAADLGRYLAGEVVRARPVRGWERALKWVRRRPALAGLLGTLALVIVAALAVVTWQLGETRAALRRAEGEQKRRALAQVNALRDATPGAVPTILGELERSRADVLPRLRELWAEGGAEARRLRLALALLPVEPGAVREPLLAWMLRADEPAEMLLAREALLPHKEELTARLWAKAEDARAPEAERFRALAALAAFDPQSRRWGRAGEEVIGQLLSANPLHLGTWTQALRPVRASLVGPLGEVFRGHRLAEHRRAAAVVLADYAAADPDALAELLPDADPRQYAVLRPVLAAHRARATRRLRRELTAVARPDWNGAKPRAPLAERESLAKRQAQAGAALLDLGDEGPVWPLFRHNPEPEARSQLLWRAGLLKVDPLRLVRRLEAEEDASARAALVVALGDYSGEQLPPRVRGPLTRQLLGWYRDDPDPGVHGAIDWLLRHAKEGPASRPLDWGVAAQLRKIDEGLKRRDPDGKRGWYVNGQGQTMVLVPGPVVFRMGSLADEPGHQDWERLHRRRVGRSYALASKAVTVEQFQRFLKDRPDVPKDYAEEYSPQPECPINGVSWYMAARYCNWLSEKEGIPEDQWCYPRHREIKEGMKPYPDYLKRTGYRLATEAEWEHACRAGAVSSRSYGSSVELLPRYAWYQANSQDRRGSIAPGRWVRSGPTTWGYSTCTGAPGRGCRTRIGTTPTGRGL
jgi:hypothetical protein